MEYLNTDNDKVKIIIMYVVGEKNGRRVMWARVREGSFLCRQS